MVKVIVKNLILSAKLIISIRSRVWISFLKNIWFLTETLSTPLFSILIATLDCPCWMLISTASQKVRVPSWAYWLLRRDTKTSRLIWKLLNVDGVHIFDIILHNFLWLVIYSPVITLFLIFLSIFVSPLSGIMLPAFILVIIHYKVLNVSSDIRFTQESISTRVSGTCSRIKGLS